METANVIEAMSSHLEFIGYKITKNEKNTRAEGATVPRIITIRELASGVMFSTGYNCSDNGKNNRAGLIEWMNFINQKATLITAFAEEGGFVTFAAWFPKSYDKITFGNFFKVFCDDVNKSLYGTENAKTNDFLL